MFLVHWLMTPFRYVQRLPQVVAGMSLPARIAAVVGFFLVTLVVLAFTALLFSDENVLQAWWTPGRVLLVALLLFVTPLVVYMAAKLWLEREASKFPDILAAWQAAVAELERQGIDLTQTPLFLVLGAASDEQEQGLLDDVPCELLVRAAPSGAAALHAYGGDEAVFICVGAACQASEVARRGGSTGGGPRRAAVVQPAAAALDPRFTAFVPTGGEPDPPAMPAAEPPASHSASFDPNKTVDIASLVSASATPGAAAGSTRAASLAAEDRERLARRLQYVCELIRRARGSLAPLNGVLALIHGPLLRADADIAPAIGRALAEDLATIRRHAGLRAPVTVAVVGLEDDAGFAELVSRTPAAVRQQRSGQKFPIGLAPTYEQLGSVAVRACGHAEDMVMARCFREKGVVDKPGNRNLAALVSRLRSETAPRLKAILQRAFIAAEGDSSDAAPLLAGCYLAAGGANESQRGFVRGVFEKVLDAQGDLEWTPAAERADQVAGSIARVLWIISGLMLAGVVAWLAWTGLK